MFMNEYEDSEQSHERRCRICDGLVETSVQLVCDDCDRQDTEEMEREAEIEEFFPADEEQGGDKV